MQSKDIHCLQAILESIQKIGQYSAGVSGPGSFLEHPIVFDACLMNVVNIGEMVYRLTDEFTETHPSIEWHKIRGLRNIIAHDYFGIDYDEVWAIISIHIPQLKAFISTLKDV